MFNGAITRAGYGAGMIDNLSLAISHGLMLLAAWRLLWRPDLDTDRPAETRRGFLKRPPGDADDA